MGKYARVLCKVLLSVFIGLAIVAEMLPWEWSGVLLDIHLAALLPVIGMGYVVYKLPREIDPYPDLLREISHRYYERSGVCLMPRVEVLGNVAHLCVYFQNRYERAVLARLVMQPGIRRFRFSRYALPRCSVAIRCPGAAFGVARMPLPVPREYLGNTLPFEFAADVTYPARCGKLLRRRGGRAVRGTANLSQRRRVLQLLIGLPFHHIVEELPTKVWLMLPSDLADSIPPTHRASYEILWQPSTAGEQAALPQNVAA